ncbi:MAG TPA: hypothetical protein VIR63_01765 [Pontiella sp.]
MKKIITTTLAASLVASVYAADVTLDFASAYVFRGYTFNDGAVIQPGIEAAGLGLAEELGSVSVGAWGNIDVNDPYDSDSQTSQFSEIDWYASYGLPSVIDGLDLSVGYCEYTYPLNGGSADKEVNVGAGFEVAGVSFGATIYKLIGGAYVGDTWYEVSAGYGIDVSDEVALGLSADARVVDSVGGESGFNDYTLGADLSYTLNDVWSAGASITYIGQGDDEVLVEEDGGYDVDVVGMFSLAASF